jgi:hypothetical protein
MMKSQTSLPHEQQDNRTGLALRTPSRPRIHHRNHLPSRPISGEIEERHDPDFLLSNYRDEARWSATIAEWGRKHALFIEADEE